MLGFIVGALFVWALPRPPVAPAPVSSEVKPAAPAIPPRPRLTDVEDYFTEWHHKYAVWMDDVTYVCAPDAEYKTYPYCFEVLRRGDAFYFRSVPRPRRMKPVPNLPSNSPLEFLNPVGETTRSPLGERVLPPDLEPAAVRRE